MGFQMPVENSFCRQQEPMRVHVLQHLPFEDLGNIALNLQDRGAQVSHTHYVQRESEILGVSPDLYQNIHSVMNDLPAHLANSTPGKAPI
jgi:hypothetical protein